MRVLASSKDEIPGLTEDMDIFMVRCLHGLPVLYEFEVHCTDQAAMRALENEIHSRPLSGAYIHSADIGRELDRTEGEAGSQLLRLLDPVLIKRLTTAFRKLRTVEEAEVVISTIKGKPASVFTRRKE